jgi:DNA polymerase-1
MDRARTILLVDAHAQIYRGFYGVRSLTTRSGEPSNAVFAIGKFLLALAKDYPDANGAFVFDKGRCEHRTKLAPDYKANRPPMPDELSRQIPAVRALVTAFGWPILEMEFVEADDIIAALAGSFPGNPIRIVSHDKDLCQLVDDRVRMLSPGKSSGLVELGPDEVYAKFGVGPGQIVDYLSLIGDSSDNIPGVPGIGPKTAAKLLEEFDSIDGLFSKGETIENTRIREKIFECRDLLLRNRELITLCPPEISGEIASQIRVPIPDPVAIAAIIERYELKSLKSEIDRIVDAAAYDRSAVPAPPVGSAPAPADSTREPPSTLYTPDLFA